MESATHSPSADRAVEPAGGGHAAGGAADGGGASSGADPDAPRGRGGRGRPGLPSLIPWRLRRLGPRTLQSRLTLGFAGVVALTLFLVTVFVLNRLDDQFRQQQQADLVARADLIARFVDALASEKAAGGPVVTAENVVNPAVAAALRSDAYQRFMADRLAEADIDIVLGQRPSDTGDASGIVAAINGAFHAAVETPSRPGLTKESLVADPMRRISTFSPFPYVIEVRLSNPYTFRQVTIDNVTTIAAAVGAIALGIAVIVAAGMAIRVTTPLRRLTEASRALAEGELGRRIPGADVRAGSSELAALAVQFNAMADQLEESVEIIRRDRDRSRDFLADVSHELRTPIAALLTFNELLTERAGDDPQARAEFLENSRIQLERLDWLAQNLLELSKLDSGLVLLDLRPDDLRAAIESAVEQAGPAGRRRGVRLTLSLPQAPIRLRHDPQRIGQVVTNLVGNAIKFTEPGGLVTVSARPSDDGGALIEVTDTGVGIEPAELPRIFDRFYRGSRANEARGSGSGLGLAIVRSIVDMHRGSVEVSSRLGSGTTFRVALPADPRRDDVAPPAGSPATSGAPSTTATSPDGATVAGSEAIAAAKVVDSSPTGRPSLNRESSG
ncbi:MAG TPA: HAMP domain-containing sensor histidine kinase [Candidatus Limnocylindrales bacterium]|nr:HAMP domain-containing sensor histidine kinase [Candidatus Limnocylindrales bacterium]